MNKTLNSNKYQWNKEHYTQIKVSVKPEIAIAFKNICKSDKLSMAGEITKFTIERSSNIPILNKPEKDLLKTRGGRRNLLNTLIQKLGEIKDAEEQYRDNIPINLQGSINYDAAEQCISEIEEALDVLNRAF